MLRIFSCSYLPFINLSTVSTVLPFSERHAFQIGFYHLGICFLAFLSHSVRQSSPCYIGPY